ncbi:hypothetical protein BH18THE1_BH18THE1_16850 [soil metagenome]
MESQPQYEEEIGGICILDILGTKGVWKRDPGEYLGKVAFLYDKFNSLVQVVKQKVIEELEKYSKNKYIYDAQFRTFSDTVIITSTFRLIKADCVNSSEIKRQLELHLFILGFILVSIIASAIQERIYLRGSLCLGKIYRKDSIIIGPAIDEAASDYDQSNWIGVSLTPNASLLLNSPENSPFSKLVKDFFTQYDVAKRTGTDKSCDVLNWPRFYFKGFTDSIDLIKDNLIFRLDESTDYNVYMKYKNTLEFCNHVAKNGRHEFTEYMESAFPGYSGT